MSWIVKNLDDNNVGGKHNYEMNTEMFVVANDLCKKHVFLTFAV